MGAMASQITSITIIYSTVYSDADQRKHQSYASPVSVRGIHRWPVISLHAGNAENVSIWWRHHAEMDTMYCVGPVWAIWDFNRCQLNTDNLLNIRKTVGQI